MSDQGGKGVRTKLGLYILPQEVLYIASLAQSVELPTLIP